MATRRPPSQKTGGRSSAAKERSAARRAQAVGRSGGRSPVEPTAARVLQSLILAAGITLLLSALFGWQLGLALVGGLVLASALPPLRRHVDRWLVGKIKGDEANQAAVIRMVVGVLILIVVLASVLR